MMKCSKCGSEIPEGTNICPQCNMPAAEGAVPGEGAQQIETKKNEKPENVTTGFLGALLGAILGGAIIIGVSRLGYVASITGFLLAVFVIKGYILLGHKLSTIGLILCTVLMLITPYAADRLDWAILVMQEVPEAGLSKAYQAIPELIKLGGIEKGPYVQHLVMLYIYVLVGGFTTILDARRRLRGGKKKFAPKQENQDGEIKEDFKG